MENDFFSIYVTEGASCEAHGLFGTQGGDSVRPMGLVQIKFLHNGLDFIN